MFTYTPNAGTSGADSFDFKVNSDAASVAVLIISPETVLKVAPPTANTTVTDPSGKFSLTLPAGASDQNLTLTFWNGSRWVNLMPCDGCSLNREKNELTIAVDHFTEFAMLGSARNRAYLPFVRSGNT